MLTGKIGPPNIANEQSISCEYGFRPESRGEVSHNNADAFQGMPWSGKKVEAALTELDGVAFMHRGVGKGCTGASTQVNPRSSARSKFMVPRDEVGVKMALNDVLDLQILLPCGFDVNIDVALRIDNSRDPIRSDQIGSVGQATEKEMFDLNHNFALRSVMPGTHTKHP